MTILEITHSITINEDDETQVSFHLANGVVLAMIRDGKLFLCETEYHRLVIEPQSTNTVNVTTAKL